MILFGMHRLPKLPERQCRNHQFEVYDILRQQSNISRSLTADMRSVSEYNGINSYCMLRFSYRLNVFGNKEARGNMRHGGFDGGGPRGPRGGFGGGRPH